jgi:hypothetical protein
LRDMLLPPLGGIICLCRSLFDCLAVDVVPVEFSSIGSIPLDSSPLALPLVVLSAGFCCSFASAVFTSSLTAHMILLTILAMAGSLAPPAACKSCPIPRRRIMSCAAFFHLVLPMSVLKRFTVRTVTCLRSLDAMPPKVVESSEEEEEEEDDVPLCCDWDLEDVESLPRRSSTSNLSNSATSLGYEASHDRTVYGVDRLDCAAIFTAMEGQVKFTLFLVQLLCFGVAFSRKDLNECE